MTKTKFKPFYYATRPSNENLDRLNDIFTLYFALQSADLIDVVAALEFYDGVGRLLGGTPLSDLHLEHVEIMK